MCYELYNFFDNSTVSILMAVFLGGYFAIEEYKKQKKIDRNEQEKLLLIENLITLDEKVSYVILILNRMVHTKKQIKSSEDIKIFLDALEKYETPRLSNVLNEDIPFLKMKIDNLLRLYGYNPQSAKIIEYKDELKKWHQNV